MGPPLGYVIARAAELIFHLVASGALAHTPKLRFEREQVL